MYLITYIKEFLAFTLRYIMRPRPDSFIANFRKQIHTRNKAAASLVKDCYSIFLSDHTLIEHESPGAGSKKNKKGLTVSMYAKRTAVNPVKGNLLLQVACYFKPELIIELGTSFGFSTMFMSLGSPKSRIITVEGNPQIADITAANFRMHQFDQIKVVNALFDDILPYLISNVNSNTMVFIDGNHTFEATMRYVHSFASAKLIVLDDIRWSKPMAKAWNEIVARGSAITVIDLFSMGIIIPSETFRLYHLLL